MGQGDKRKSTDRVYVSTKGGGEGGGRETEQQCPLSFQVKLESEHRKHVGVSVTAKADGNTVIIMHEGKSIAQIVGQRGTRIAQCIRDGQYKYEGAVVLEKDNIYAQLRIA